MPVTPAYREFVLEPLRRVAPVTARGMFGGVGLHSDGLFFGLLDDDRSYLKTDALTRASQKDAGAEPFRPSGGGSPMQYYELAPELLEEPDELRPWVENAIAAARRAARR
jgi:DNA transformation protein and related proteins